MAKVKDLHAAITAALRLAEAEQKVAPTNAIGTCVIKLQSAQRHLALHDGTEPPSGKTDDGAEPSSGKTDDGTEPPTGQPGDGDQKT